MMYVYTEYSIRLRFELFLPLQNQHQIVTIAWNCMAICSACATKKRDTRETNSGRDRENAYLVKQSCGNHDQSRLILIVLARRVHSHRSNHLNCLSEAHLVTVCRGQDVNHKVGSNDVWKDGKDARRTCNEETKMDNVR